MKTYLELEGKLGPKFQPQSDQSRPAQPNTYTCVRKETKATEKRKKCIHTKKYKVKVVARPKSKTSNTTMQLPSTTPNAPTNSERQNPPQEGTSDSNPHHSKISQLVLAPHGPKQERCQEISLSCGRTGQSLPLLLQNLP